MSARCRDDDGFSMVEMLVATLITLAVAGAVLGLLAPTRAAFDTQPETSDLHQRLRVAASTLLRDISTAGASPHGLAGSLGDVLAPVRPYRVGRTGADPPGTFKPDTISVLAAPAAAGETAIVRKLPAVGPEQVIETRSDCGGARADAGCGFQPRMPVALVARSGAFELGVVSQAYPASLHVTGAGPLPADFDRGDAAAVEIAAHTYYLEADIARGVFQLRHYDGLQTDLPAVDHVVKLSLRYWGEAEPPRLLADVPLDGPGPWTTYGPAPPEIGATFATSWPPGENCAFVVTDGAHAPRLPVLPADPDGLVELTAPLLSDGPWCPDALGAARYDADLLRVRRVEVTLRVQAALAALRGPASALFANAGTAGPSRYVPDQEVRFAVSPRNLASRR